MLREGELRRYDGRIWRVGLVNTSRARLDPVSGSVVASPVSGKCFVSYGGSVNVGASSDGMPLVDPLELSESEKVRLARVTREAGMAVAAPPVGGVSAAGPSKGTGAANKVANDERKAKLEEDKVKKAAEKEAAKAERAAKAKEPKVLNDCKCGCGSKTGGNFYPGHDARFKGWLLQIERGEKKPEELLTEPVRKSYQWRKSADGKGLIPTTNYKGEPHTGYDNRA